MRKGDNLSKKDQEDLVLDLVQAFSSAKNLGEAALFLQDLITKSEMRILAKRLRIAKLLISGMTYKEIEESLRTSHTTVAKIAEWLAERGDGFRKILERIPKREEQKFWTEHSDWDQFKHKYSLYFWPELLLEEVIKSASMKKKEQIRKVINQLEKK